MGGIKTMLVMILAAVFIAGCGSVTGKVVDDVKQYTLQEISQHDSEDDCWMAIGGKVYDITEFIALGKHGKAVLAGCGKEATELYETRPMGSGTPHSETARSLLEKYYIGELS